MGKLKEIDEGREPDRRPYMPPGPRPGGRDPLRAIVRHPEQLDRDMDIRAAARPPASLNEEYELALWREDDGMKVVRVIAGPYLRAIGERDKAMATGKYSHCWLTTGSLRR